MIPDKKYVVIISDPIQQEKEDIANNLHINNQDIYITENGTYLPAEGYTGIGRATVNVAGTTPVIESLSITPETEAQTFNPLEGVNGFAPVSVAAVTAAIDSNISANNIKTGVSILGVAGNVVELKGETKTISPTTSQQTITPTTPTYNGLTSVTVNAVTSSIDTNIIAGNIKNGVTILGVTGNYGGTTPTIDPLSITPTTSQQTITASGGVDGYSPITVSAVTSSIDANISAENIKNGVTILGVTGNYSGGVTPTGTINISSNGTYDVTNYASASVTVPSTAPDYYLSFTLSSSGNLSKNIQTIVNFSNIKNLSNYTMAYLYYHTNLSGSITFPNLQIIGQYALHSAFAHTRITSISFPNLQSVYNYGLYYCCNYCSSLTSIDLGNLTTVSGTSALANAFSYCSGLVNVDFSSITSISGTNAFQYALQNCTNLVSLDLSGLTTISGASVFYSMCQQCSSLTTVNLSSLTTITGYTVFQSAFSGCTSLSSITFTSLTDFTTASSSLGNLFYATSFPTPVKIYFPAFTSSTFGTNTTALKSFLNLTTNVEVHFPSNLAPQSGSTVISGLDGYPSFSGTNVTLLFDLTATS